MAILAPMVAHYPMINLEGGGGVGPTVIDESQVPVAAEPAAAAADRISASDIRHGVPATSEAPAATSAAATRQPS